MTGKEGGRKGDSVEVRRQMEARRGVARFNQPLLSSLRGYTLSSPYRVKAEPVSGYSNLCRLTSTSLPVRRGPAGPWPLRGRGLHKTAETTGNSVYTSNNLAINTFA